MPSIRVPFLVRLPQTLDPGPRRLGGLVSLLDVALTVMDVFGLPVTGPGEAPFQGTSLLSRLADGVAGDIAAVIGLLRAFPAPENREWIFGLAAGNMGLSSRLLADEILPNEPPHANDLMGEMLIQANGVRIINFTDFCN